MVALDNAVFARARDLANAIDKYAPCEFVREVAVVAPPDVGDRAVGLVVRVDVAEPRRVEHTHANAALEP